MKASNAIVVMHVTDLDIAIQYYTNVLGFALDFVFGNYAGLNHGFVGIQLNGPDHNGIKKVPGNGHVCIFCDKVDDYYHAIADQGALISVKLADREYGLRDFAVNDQDGNTMVFGAPIA